MSKQLVFSVNVLHNGKPFVVGQLCPPDLHEDMLKKGLVEHLPEPVEAPKVKADKK